MPRGNNTISKTKASAKAPQPAKVKSTEATKGDCSTAGEKKRTDKVASMSSTTPKTQAKQPSAKEVEAVTTREGVEQLKPAKRSYVPLCWSYKRGKCPNGDQCPRYHPSTPKTNATSETENVAAVPLASPATKPDGHFEGHATKSYRKRKSICRSFIHGRCKQGEQCPRRHQLPRSMREQKQESGDSSTEETSDDEDESRDVQEFATPSPVPDARSPILMSETRPVAGPSASPITDSEISDKAAHSIEMHDNAREDPEVSSAFIDNRPAKTSDRICTYWLKGRCEGYMECPLTHLVPHKHAARFKELQADNPEVTIDNRPYRRTEEVCVMYQMNRCRYGNFCPNLHTEFFEKTGPYASASPVGGHDPQGIEGSGADNTRGQTREEHIWDRRPARRTDELCVLFQLGKCQWGDKCHKTHENPFGPRSPSPMPSYDLISDSEPEHTEIDTVSERTATQKDRPGDRPVHKTDEVCRDYLRGRCLWGSRCRWMHVPPSDTNTNAARPIAESPKNAAVAQRDEAVASKSVTPPGDLMSKLRNGENSINIKEYGARDRLNSPRDSGNSQTNGTGRQSQSGGDRTHARNELHGGSTSHLEVAQPQSGPSTLIMQKSVDTVRDPTDLAKSTQPKSLVHSRQPSASSFDGSSSDTTYFSCSRSQTSQSSTTSPEGSPRQSYSAAQTSGLSLALPQQPELVCWDFQYGRCFRQNCKYPHVKVPPLLQQRPQEKHDMSSTPTPLRGRRLEPEHNPETDRLLQMLKVGADRRSGMSSSQTRPDITDDATAPKPGARSADSRYGNVPLVPPGLGFEKRIGQVLPAPRPEPPPTISIAVLDSTKVVFGPGIEVQHISTGFESRQVTLRNLPSDITSVEITEALTAFGEVDTVYIEHHEQREEPEKSKKRRGKKRDDGSSASAQITFATHEEAAQAALNLDRSWLFDRMVTARLMLSKSSLVGKGKLDDGTVLLEFPVPNRTAYAGYATKELAEQALAKANGVELRGGWVTAAFHQGLPTIGVYNLCFRGLPPDAQLKDVEQYGENDGVMITQPNYQSLQGAIRYLRETIAEFGEIISFNVLPPPRKLGTVRIWVHFDSATAAENLCKRMHGTHQRFCGKGRFYARHSRSLMYSLPSDVYNALSVDIRRFSMSVWNNETGNSVSVIDKRTRSDPRMPVRVKIVSEKLQDLTRLKLYFERLLRGDKVTQDGEVVWDGFFGRRTGQYFLQDLEKSYPGILINRDTRRRTLALFGPPDKRDAVRRAILSRYATLRSLRTHNILLSGRLIGLFMSSDLAILQKQIGPENVQIDLSERVLRIRGDADAIKVAELAVAHARERHVGEKHVDIIECPVCFNEVSSPVLLSCGHTWCKTCLSGYILAAIDNKTFPLTCLGKEATCPYRIPISIAQELLSTNDFDSLVHASFLSYVHSRPSEFYYCPTPDCPQVYRKGAPGTVLQCPSCLVRICPHCHVEHHEGVTCQDRDVEDKRLLDEWKSGRDVKNCPGCKATIEREAGCNHMTCIRCKTHICWACLATFPTSQEVYDHMHGMHGGIGL